MEIEEIRMKCLEMAERNTYLYPIEITNVFAPEMIIKTAQKFERYVVEGNTECCKALDFDKNEDAFKGIRK